MEAKVYEIVAKVMGVPPESVTERSSPAFIKRWDSLRHMRLVLAIEETFGIQFTEDEIVSIKNVGDVIRFLAPKKRA